MTDYPETKSAEYAYNRDGTVTRYRIVQTKFGPKPVLRFEEEDGEGFEFWGTPFMARQLGLVPDPPTVKRATVRVELPALIVTFPTTMKDGFKLVPVSLQKVLGK